MDGEYDDALKYCIEEIINEIHRIKELEFDRVDAVCYALFQQDIEEKYQQYMDEIKWG